MWNDIIILEKIARFAPYAFIIVGFIVAFSGQFFGSAINSRIKTIIAQTEHEFKRTSPHMNVLLGKSSSTGDLIIAMDAINLVPFKARWVIVTKKNIVVTGIMLEDHEIRPTNERRRFTVKENINAEQVVDEFIELRFKYESVYFAEVGNQESLRGKITKQYRLREGEVYDW